MSLTTSTLKKIISFLKKGLDFSQLSPRLARGTYSHKLGFSLSVIAGSLKLELLLKLPQITVINVSTITVSLLKSMNCLYSKLTFVVQVKRSLFTTHKKNVFVTILFVQLY